MGLLFGNSSEMDTLPLTWKLKIPKLKVWWSDIMEDNCRIGQYH